VYVFAFEIDEEVFDGGALFSDDLHHLTDLGTIAQDPACEVDLVGVDDARILTPAVERIDGWVPAGIGTGAGESVEGADDLECRLCDRLIEVTAGGADGTADGDGSGTPVLEANAAAALVECGDDGLEIGGECFF